LSAPRWDWAFVAPYALTTGREFAAMVNVRGEIPLLGWVEAPDADVPLVMGRRPRSLDRRLEDWIASNVDLPSESEAPDRWEQTVGNLPGLRRPLEKPGGGTGEGRQVRSSGAWSRFQVTYRRGVTVVRLVDQALVECSHLRELGDDLMDLIAVGNHRIVLNFSAVMRLGSWIVGVVGNAHRRCAEAVGGRLKLCGLDPHLAEIFTIVGMTGRIELHADEAEAVDSPWPRSSSHRALPLDIMAALTTAGGLPPLCGGSPHAVAESRVSRASRAGGATGITARPSHENRDGRVWLQVQAGTGEARKVPVSGARFVIGRERGCHLRIGSAQVGKHHAAIERRQGRVFLVDLGSTDGTIVGGRLIRGQEVEIADGDHIRIGPTVSTLSIVPASEAAGAVEGHAAGRVQVGGVSPPRAGESLTTREVPFPEELDPGRRIKCEVIQGVLVVTPQWPEMDNEEANEALRQRLVELFEQPLPRKVVVNLEFVGHISRQTIANLLAHHFRLGRAGGAVRICQAHARIAALLDQVRLTMLVDCHPTLDEAVLASWGHAGGTAEAR
jgi:anti-anti-sigma factor